ncbi:hypothetical protein FC39_GL000955 [Lactobacillus hamsteri DSM 5661 = JCM 6256]|uniref:DUF4767 domain-containing protein n=2 Tax=Lactobacillus hamsteri TaxID=96565 RepID=A0A0R1YIL0_9LACO|nr:hypothetical protein FC39_GL000955 [Lactobacillus hamsteri DSM 5661 = JCM 6256]
MSFEKDGIHINDHQQNAATSKQTMKIKKKKVKNKEIEKRKLQKNVRNTNVRNKKDKLIWSTKQDKELEKFMIQWSKSMGQKYTKYSTKNLKTSSGTVYPSALEKRRFLLNKKSIKISWNPDGKKKTNYNVVAIYNDNLKAHGMHITYLFTIKDKQGIVLQAGDCFSR